MTTKEPHVAALDKAKIAMMRRKDSAFFTSLCFSMKHKFDDSVRTACTDGTEILYSPKFFMECAPEERLGLLIHETMHVAYQHMGRLLGKDMRLWNVACDHVINLQILDRGFRLPKNGLHDPQYAGMSAEQVYKLLVQEHQAKGQPEPSEGELDLQDLKPLPSDVSIEEFSAKVEKILIRAALRSKEEQDKPGVIPGDIEILLRKLLNPKLPWQVLLIRWMQNYCRSGYSWLMPNRRYAPEHHLPSRKSKNAISLTVAIDTSGSVSDHDFQTMVSEVAGIFRLVKTKEIQLIQFDTELKSVTPIRSLGDLRKVSFTGRGGTDVTDVLEWANTHKPDLLLFFTDGGFSAPPITYASGKTLWLIHNNPGFTSDYGKVIHYEIKP